MTQPIPPGTPDLGDVPALVEQANLGPAPVVVTPQHAAEVARLNKFIDHLQEQRLDGVAENARLTSLLSHVASHVDPASTRPATDAVTAIRDLINGYAQVEQERRRAGEQR